VRVAMRSGQNGFVGTAAGVNEAVHGLWLLQWAWPCKAADQVDVDEPFLDKHDAPRRALHHSLTVIFLTKADRAAALPLFGPGPDPRPNDQQDARRDQHPGPADGQPGKQAANRHCPDRSVFRPAPNRPSIPPVTQGSAISRVVVQAFCQCRIAAGKAKGGNQQERHGRNNGQNRTNCAQPRKEQAKSQEHWPFHGLDRGSAAGISRCGLPDQGYHVGHALRSV